MEGGRDRHVPWGGDGRARHSREEHGRSVDERRDRARRRRSDDESDGDDGRHRDRKRTREHGEYEERRESGERREHKDYREHGRDHRDHREREGPRDGSRPRERDSVAARGGDGGVPDWDAHVAELDRLFFKPTDHLRKGTDEYDELWTFLRRFEEVRAARAREQPPSGAAHAERKVPPEPPGSPFADLPQRYDSRYRMNFSLLADTIPGAAGRSNRPGGRGRYFAGGDGRGSDRTDDAEREEGGGDARGRLGTREIALFLDRLRHYENFVQREKLARLVKMRRDKGNLPIARHKDEILRLVRENRVVVVSGDTGCGKSTQVPQYLVDGGFRAIACTQPRRIACVSLARRVGHEMMSPPGVLAAHHIRFEDTKSSHTRVTFVTEGLLLRQIASTGGATADGSPRYDVIVADEMHERSMQGDFLLAVLANKLLRERSDVRLVVMSATINVELFSRYFNGAPIVQVPGRLYPIDVHYLPVGDASAREAVGRGDRKPLKAERINPMPYVRIMERIDREYPQSERGDLLIFLSGTAEIAAVEAAAKEHASQTKRWIVLPLHSGLSSKAQDRCFDLPPAGVRKCVISTNIAETSVTIDGIRFVVDSGRVKEMGYDPQARMRRLAEYWVSRASAEQRKGRAGRTGPGVCYRFYTPEDFAALAPYPVPELRRVPMDSVILQLLDMGIANPRAFIFLEEPPEGAVDSALETLRMHGAVSLSTARGTLHTDGTAEGRNDEVASPSASPSLTPLGRLLARLPVDTVVGKMLVLGAVAGVAGDAMVLAAALTVQSPLLKADGRTFEKREELVSAEGDAFTVMRAFRGWAREPRGGRRRWCRERGLEEQRLIEMGRLAEQFREVLVSHGIISPPGDQEGAGGTLGGNDDYVALKDPAEGDRERRQQRRRERRREALDRLRSTNKRRATLAVGEDGGLADAGTSDEEEDERRREERRKRGRARDWRHRYGPGADAEEGKAESDSELFEADNMEGAFDDDDGDWDAMGSDEDGGERRGGGDRARVLKAVMGMGLYPQLALPDEHNAAKRDSEKIYHAQSKQFVAMHPSSVYHSDPSLAGPGDLERPRDGHQVLCYVSLLETTKPYLVGVSRTPLAPSLLLLSSMVDTTDDCRRVVVDRWIEVGFPSPDDAQRAVSAALEVRLMWRHMVARRLAHRSSMGPGSGAETTQPPPSAAPPADALPAEPSTADGVSTAAPVGDDLLPQGGESIVAPPYIAEALSRAADFATLRQGKRESAEDFDARMTRLLARAIASLMKTKVECSAARVTALQAERLGIGPGMAADVAYPSPIGGFLRWGSLSRSSTATADGSTGGAAGSASEHLRVVWRCPECGRNLIVNGAEREAHRGQCVRDAAMEDADVGPASAPVRARESHLLREFTCDVCGETLMLTSTMILRHMRAHKEEEG